MCVIHLFQNDVFVGKDAGRIYIKRSDDIQNIPVETLEGINLYGKAQVSTQAVEECMRRGIPISFFSSAGGYIGGYSGISYINVKRQRLQACFNDTTASFEVAKKIINAKITNQVAVLRRYNRTNDNMAEANINNITHYKKHVMNCMNVSQLMGYEGISAREYFEGLGKTVKPEYSFKRRSKNPPLDHFNAVLSFGYSLLYKELYGIIEGRGLNPFMGFMHEDREGHPALVSDLIEEWRPVLIDSMVMSLINGNELLIDKDFEGEQSEFPFHLNASGRKKVIDKYSKKMETTTNYLHGYSSVSYRRALEYQVRSLVHVIENDDADRYNPIIIR